MHIGLVQQYRRRKYRVLTVGRSEGAQRYLSPFFPSYLDTVCDRQCDAQMSFLRWTCCRAVGCTVSKAASNCQLLQRLPPLRRVAPPNMMALPGRPIPGDWLGCVCNGPASWAQCPSCPLSQSPTNHHHTCFSSSMNTVLRCQTHSSIKYSLNHYYVLGTIEGTGNPALNRMKSLSSPRLAR